MLRYSWNFRRVTLNTYVARFPIHVVQCLSGQSSNKLLQLTSCSPESCEGHEPHPRKSYGLLGRSCVRHGDRRDDGGTSSSETPLNFHQTARCNGPKTVILFETCLWYEMCRNAVEACGYPVQGFVCCEHRSTERAVGQVMPWHLGRACSLSVCPSEECCWSVSGPLRVKGINRIQRTRCLGEQQSVCSGGQKRESGHSVSLRRTWFSVERLQCFSWQESLYNTGDRTQAQLR
jgi:hypothetical protein